MATRRTQLRRRKELIQWKVCPPLPGRLVFQFPEYLPERRVYYVLGKIVILGHPDHVQSFDIDRLVFADDLRRKFLKRISSGIADFGVQPGYSKPGFLSIITVLDLSRQTALKYPQSLFILNERARIFELFALAGSGQRLDTNIYADFGFGLFEWLNIGFNQDTHKIPIAGVTADGQIEGFSVIRKRATPNNVERFGLLCQSDSAVSKGEGVGGVSSRLAMTARFKFRILRSLLEEVSESRIEIKQRLLKNNRTDLGKKGLLGLFFPLGEFQRSVMIVNGFLFLLPGFTAIVQSLIVDIANAAEGSPKLRNLRISWEESVFESLLDYHGDILKQIGRLCNGR
jgi:hypothetical protein